MQFNVTLNNKASEMSPKQPGTDLPMTDDPQVLFVYKYTLICIQQSRTCIILPTTAISTGHVSLPIPVNIFDHKYILHKTIYINYGN